MATAINAVMPYNGKTFRHMPAVAFRLHTDNMVCVCVRASGDISISSVLPRRGRHYGSHRHLIDLLFCWDTHPNCLSIIERHTRPPPILISHSSSHRQLTDASPRRTGGVKEAQAEGFGMGVGLHEGIPLFLIGCWICRHTAGT